MIIKYIEKIQQMSEKKRRLIIIAISGSLPLIILLVWFLVFYNSSGNKQDRLNKESPFQELKKVGSAIFGSFKK